MATKSFNLKSAIARLDSQNVGISVALLPEQIAQVAREFPRNASLKNLKKKKWNAVVVCAMGGSALGSDILRFLYEADLRVPFSIVNDYTLPRFVDRNTLVIAITYSGTTEETLACFNEALRRGCSVFAISTGGKLVAAERRRGMAHYAFTSTHNPSGQPRMGNGYTMTAVYMLLKHCSLLSPSHDPLIPAARRMRVSPHTALAFAQKTSGKVCIIMAAEHLRGIAHLLSNQINENAKIIAPFYFIPELNHHLLEGMEELKKNAAQYRIVLLESDAYPPRIRKRFAVTKEVLNKQGLTHYSLSFSGSRASQAMKAFSFCSYWGYYLAILSGRDPAPIPWVDYFKKRLA